MSDSNQLTAENDEIIFGKNAVLAFLTQAESTAAYPAKLGKGGRVNKIFMAAGARLDVRLEKIKQLAKQQGVPVTVVEPQRLDRLVAAQERHQGVVAYISQVAMLQLDEFLNTLPNNVQAAQLSAKTDVTVAILDGIEDPHNLGAIIRTAECAGLSAIILPARRSAGITGTVAKTSAGAVACLPIVRVGNVVNAIEILKKAGFWVVGTDGEAKQSCFEADLTGRLAIVIGAEGEGVSRLVREHCDFLLRIPMLGKTNSLNASVAAGIVFYEAVRQRLNSQPQ